MKKNKAITSIKINIFKYFAIFVLIVLVLLWLFQIVFLDDFYKFIKTNDIKSATKKITHNLDDEYINDLAEAKDFGVIITNEDNTVTYSANLSGRMTIYNASPTFIASLINSAKENGGEYLETLNYQTGVISKGDGDITLFRKPASIIYTMLLSGPDGKSVAVITNADITPIDTTVDTLRVQLTIITVIILLLAGLIAYIISTQVAKPIEAVTKKARDLASGNYEPMEIEGSFKEVNDLIHTFNYAAEEINKTENYRRELIANTSHDLRTPLTMITGYSELIKDMPEEELDGNIDVIITESKRLSQLVSDMLDLTKYESRSSNLKYEVFNLTYDIKSTINRFKVLTDFNIDFEYEKEVFVKADRLKISQVVYNLLSNAFNYTGNDKKIIVKQTIKDKKVKIEVIDTGDGIAQENIQDIWQRYYKIDKEHKRVTVGSGIGLSLVKAIMDNHKGEYGVESEIGKGSTFWFILDEVDPPDYTDKMYW